MDAPPIPRLVDLVHAFNGVVVEQFKKRLEKLRSDSILLWRLLKLLFEILQQLIKREVGLLDCWQKSKVRIAKLKKIAVRNEPGDKAKNELTGNLLLPK